MISTNLNDFFFSSSMATDSGTVFSTFSTLGKYYIRRALSEAKCSASEAMTGNGREGKGNSRALNLKICLKYPFEATRMHIKLLPNWPCKVSVLIRDEVLFHGPSLGAAMMSSNPKNYRSVHQINIFRRTRYLLAPEFSDCEK